MTYTPTTFRSFALAPSALTLKEAVNEAKEHDKTCIHEAAHAVAANLHGFDVAWVSCDPEFIRNDPLAIENHCSRSMGTSMVIASTLLDPVLRRGLMTSRADKLIVMGYCIETLAGPVAEEMFDPDSFDARHSCNDYGQARSILAHLVRSKFERKSYYRQAVKDSSTLVRTHWGLISYLAHCLKVKKTLMREDINELVASGLSAMRKAA
jgi:hypothetical protein